MKVVQWLQCPATIQFLPSRYYVTKSDALCFRVQCSLNSQVQEDCFSYVCDLKIIVYRQQYFCPTNHNLNIHPNQGMKYTIVSLQGLCNTVYIQFLSRETTPHSCSLNRNRAQASVSFFRFVIRQVFPLESNFGAKVLSITFSTSSQIISFSSFNCSKSALFRTFN